LAAQQKTNKPRRVTTLLHLVIKAVELQLEPEQCLMIGAGAKNKMLEPELQPEIWVPVQHP